MYSLSTLVTGGVMLIATPLAAEIRFSFAEGAPKDRFSIINEADCATGALEVTIDLSTSAGKLIFDTTDAGAGVEVFQPFELIAGEDMVLSATPITDGDDKIQMSLASMSPGAKVTFTIDADDRLTNGALGQIRVAGSEIEGALATVTSAEEAVSGSYDRRSQAVLAYDACL